jgi:hypothetical protein
MPTYAQIIKHALKHAAANPPRVDHLTLEELHQAVADISAELQGFGISAADRLVMNEDRKVYRAEIAKRTSA